MLSRSSTAIRLLLLLSPSLTFEPPLPFRDPALSLELAEAVDKSAAAVVVLVAVAAELGAMAAGPAAVAAGLVEVAAEPELVLDLSLEGFDFFEGGIG